MINVKEYADALFLLSEEEGSTESDLSDIKTVKAVFSENPSYKNLLDTPALPMSEKLKLIDEAFASLGEHTRNLLKILAEKHGIYATEKLADAYLALYDTSRGIERVTAVSAVALSEAQLSALKEKLEGLTGKTVIITNTVDKSIIGGMKLRYMGIQLDASLKTRLDGFERALRGTIL